MTSPAKVPSRWVQANHSRLAAISTRRFQHPLPSLRYPSSACPDLALQVPDFRPASRPRDCVQPQHTLPSAHLHHINPELIKSVAMISDQYPFGPDNGIIDMCSPDCARKPSLSWTRLTDMIKGLIAEVPGKIWKYMTGHLTKIQSPINRSYFDKIEYGKIPSFWYSLMNVHQLQHALGSISDKTLDQDGWSQTDPRDFPSELNQTFDRSLLEAQALSLLTRSQRQTPALQQ